MAAVNHAWHVCLNNAPTLFLGCITRPYSNLPFPFTSVSNSLFCSSSSYSPLRAHSSSPRHYGSSVSHISPALPLGGPGSQRTGSRIEEDEDNVSTPAGFQQLGGKEKKELRAYAHGLRTRLNVQQVGKLGVSPTVVTSISDALEANEIVKVKVLENCSSDMSEIITQLEQGTRGQVVGKIGRTVLLYRASLKKLAASEKRPEKPKQRSRR